MTPGQSCDVVVAGATLGGCLTALAAARRGARVALVEGSPFLGTDLTAVLRLWLAGTPPDDAAGRFLRAVLMPAAEVAEDDVDRSGLDAAWHDETALFRGSIRKGLLGALDAAGVVTLLQCQPAAVLTAAGGRVGGLWLGSKQGLLQLTAPAVIDATAAAAVLRLHTPAAVIDPPRPEHRFTLGFAGAAWPSSRRLAVDPDLGLASSWVGFHAGRHSACPLWAEVAFSRDATAAGPRADRCAVEILARQEAMALLAWLVRTEPALHSAVLAEMAAAVWSTPPAVEAAAVLPSGLWRGPSGLSAAATWSEALACLDQAEALAAAVETAGAGRADAPAALTAARPGPSRVDTATTRLEPLDDPGLGLTLEAVHLASLDGVPHEPGADVLVAGAGTAGAPAALAALEAGATTAVVEQLSDPGGTQTIGLVGGYYHGYRGGITARLDAEQAALAERLHPGRGGVRRLLRMAHYLDAIVRHGGRWYPGAVVCGGVVDGDRVRGLLVADREGLVVLPAAVTLDATGDGDAAVHCGVAASFGDARSGNAQDCSQWSLGRGGAEAVATDLDVIDQRLLSEVLRGQRLAHRLGRHFDFTGMLTVREGRHIEGETTLDLRDVFSGRCFEDTIAVACSDWDPHGPSASWLGRLGFLPLQTVELPVRVPLRCCIPRGRRGLMVTAKAISATPDAACLCRMVPDIQNLGYATGLAAAMAATADGDPRRIDVAALVGRLRDLGIVVDRLATPWPVADPPEGAVARLAAGDEMALRDLVLATPAAAVPLLEAAFAAAPEGPGRLQLAKGLAWFGSRRGETLLVAALRDLAASERWPCDDGHPHKPGKPRAGMVDGPDDYWRLNQLLVLLGLCRAVDAAAAVAAVIDRTDAGGAPSTGINPYFRGRIDMRRVPHFDRLLSIAFCAERLGEPCLAAPLEALLEREFVGGYAHRGLDGAGQRYQGALAEVHLAAAATRCGSLDAARRLAGFCAEAHAILARFASRELQQVVGPALGPDRAAWEACLRRRRRLTPQPLPATDPAF